MSFGYPQMGSNPMHPMHLLNNVNGTNLNHSFMNPLAGINMAALAGLNNNAQLEYNLKKNQPPAGSIQIPMDLESNDPKEPRLKMNNGQEHKDEPLLDTPEKTAMNNMNMLQNNDMMFNSLMGAGFMPGGFMGMMMDPTLLGMQQFSMLGQMGTPSAPQQPTVSETSVVAPAAPLQPVKEIITCKSCTLFPPNPNTPAPTTRDRPLGCRTVFVGGLPENCTEQILHEIFERCGEVTSLRLSVKNFCHIRFVYEASVDSAIYLSGYRLRIGPQSQEATNCGRLHVDYAQARDDQYEFECRQRQLQREARHREKSRHQRSSPPPIVHYTEHESSSVAEKLKNDETFLKAVHVLVAWLERGDCSKRNSNTFYSMIQSTNSHVRRLSSDKHNMEDQLEKAKAIYKKQMQNLLTQFTQIEKVFSAASHKKVWDHFTKAQRKNIDVWKKQSLDMRSIQLTDIQDEDEMEMSDDERDSSRPPYSKRTRYDNDKLKEDNDSLKCQLQAYKNEVNLVKSDIKSDVDIKIQQIQVLQETIRNMQTQLLENKSKERDNYIRIHELESKLKEANVKQLLLKTKIVNASTKNPTSSKNSEADDNEVRELLLDSPTIVVDAKVAADLAPLIASPSLDQKTDATLVALKPELAQPPSPINLTEAKVIGLVSTFLVVHPFGASTDYIWAYITRTTPSLRPKELEEILSRYHNLFQDEVTGVGAKIERKWKYRGFDLDRDEIKKVDST